MSLSPWDVGTVFSFDFAVYQPRRRSYLKATRARSSRSCYRRATSIVNTTVTETQVVNSGTDGVTSDPEDVSLTGKDASGDAESGLQVQVSAMCLPHYTPVNRQPLNASSLFVPLSLASETPEQAPVHPNHPHKHNITIALNDEPIDRIKTRCTSPSCQSRAGEKGKQVCQACAAGSLRYKRNLAILCIGFVLVYSAFRAVQNLQTTLLDTPEHPNLGSTAMFTVYMSMFASYFFIPFFTQKVNAKWCILIGLICYILWLAANISPVYPFLIPMSVVLGVGQSLAWNAQVAYLAKLSRDFYVVNRQAASDILKWNALFLACFQSAHVWGNLASSLLLQPTTSTLLATTTAAPLVTENPVAAIATNVSSPTLLTFEGSRWNRSGNGVRLADHVATVSPRCGRNFCKTTWDLSASRRQLIGLNPMITAQLALAAGGFLLVICFLQHIHARAEQGRSALKTLKANCVHLCFDGNFRLLIPLLIFNGFEQGFICTAYNQSYVACSLGARFIGFNMIAMGGASTLSFLLMALTAFRIPREVLMAGAALLQLTLCIVLFAWEPQGQPVLPMLLVSGLWGLCDAVWQTQCSVLIGTGCHGNSETAFINFRMLQALGAALAFAVNMSPLAEVRLYVLLGLLLLSMLLYVPVELRIRRSWRKVVRQQESSHHSAAAFGANGEAAVEHSAQEDDHKPAD